MASMPVLSTEQVWHNQACNGKKNGSPAAAQYPSISIYQGLGTDIREAFETPAIVHDI